MTVTDYSEELLLVPIPSPLEISLDLSSAQRQAERTREILEDARQRMDLAPFEYCKAVRIAPLEIPFSHPQITLNGLVRDELSLLCMYLHEQMHWYLTWYAQAQNAEWRALLAQLENRYPDAPVGGADAAADRYSTLLHLIVNWCEVEVVSRFIARERVLGYVSALPFYRWIYRTVLADWDDLGALYRDVGLVPIRLATTMSEDDLRMAARPDEVAT